jgi:hypothetical protein
MFEFMGLIGLIFLFGLVCLAASIIVLPFYLLFRLMGFAIKVGVAGIFLALFGLLLLPVFFVIGALLFLKILIFGIPLLIAFALFSFLAGFFRKDEQQPIIVQAAPPVSS